VFRFASSDLDLQLGHRRKIRPGSWTHRHAACISAAAGTGARASRRRMSSRLCMPCERSIADEIRGAKPVAIHIFFLVILSSFKLWRGSERDMHAPALCNPRRVPSRRREGGSSDRHLRRSTSTWRRKHAGVVEETTRGLHAVLRAQVLEW